jgi:hypothetical protein
MEGDPTSYEEAMRSPHSSKWVEAMDETLVEKRVLVAHLFGICVAHMRCATIATPLVHIYQWRISICTTHSLNFSGAYGICAISILCMAHITICATNT